MSVVFCSEKPAATTTLYDKNLTFQAKQAAARAAALGNGSAPGLFAAVMFLDGGIALLS
jgi:hypothetical protein